MKTTNAVSLRDTQQHPKTGCLFFYACLLFATVCVSTSTAQIVYDDFSSGNLDKWSVVPAEGNAYSISSSILTLEPSGTPKYGYSTYTSTKSDFSFARSTGNPTGVFFDMPANAFIRTTEADGVYEEFNFGIKYSAGDTLYARISWNGNGSSRFDIFHNTTQLAAWWQGDITTMNTAGNRFALEWDGSTANVKLYNSAGTSLGTYVSTAFSGAVGNSGSIFFQFNTPPSVGTGEASISMDSIGVVPEPLSQDQGAVPELTLDAQQPRAIQPTGPNTWGGVNPQGAKFVVTSQGLEIGGKPFVPVAGEMHPTRTNEEAWEESILKMKAGGFNTVSSYILWNHLEMEPGKFDFTGNRNIRKFVQLCAKHGMYVWLRPGPFVNGESLFGGLPQWLFGVPGRERSNDPAYLNYVKRYYGKLGEQLKGLMFKDGGPVIAVQPENELGWVPVTWDHSFPGAGYGHERTDQDEAHLLQLKKMAEEAGMDAPLFTATGWGTVPMPWSKLLPTFGVYSFLGAGGPSEASTFTDNYGRPPEFYRYPVAYVELGTGCPSQADWRPIVPPESAEVSLLTRAACGGSMFAMFMYHGGTNPFGTRGPLNVSRNYPIMSYDFFAPIGEFGRLRDSYRALRPLANFLTGFPELITPTVTIWPGEPVRPDDTKNLRYVARIDGNRGFLFINNYQDKLKMPPREGVRIKIKLKDETITVPADDKGMNLAADAMAVLPLNLEMSGARLKYATAQLLACLDNDGHRTWVFFAPGGMSAEYAFDESSVAATAGATPTKDKGVVRIPVPEPGTSAIFEVTPVGGKSFSVLTLTRQQAVNVLKSDKLWGAQRLVLSNDDILTNGDTLRVSAVGNNELSFAVYPPPAELRSEPSETLAPQKDGVFSRYALTLPKREIKADIAKPEAGQLVVKVPRKEFDQLNDIFLRVDYTGDRGWAFLDSHLVADNFNNGLPWEIGLKRWREQLGGDGLFLRAAPWKTDASKIVFDGIAFRPTGNANEPAAIKSVTLVPEYAAEIRLP